MTRPRTLALPLCACAMLVVAACGRHEAPVPPSGAPQPAAASEAVAFVADPATPAGGSCSLDAVNGTGPAAGAATAGTAGPTLFAGWMGTAAGQVPASAKLVLAGDAGAFAVPVTGGGARDDVASALGQPGLATSGYNLSASLAQVPAGSYALSILIEDAPASSCALNVTLTVGAAG